MCEYCGCQALEAIDLLTREHDRALDHVRAAEQAVREGSLPAARRACADLRALLVPHTHVEEQALLPAMETDFPEQVARLRAEHRVIEEVVQEVAEGWAPRGWEKRLGAAMTVLRLHIHHEQDGVFPAALSTLAVADWERLDQVRAQVGTALEAGATA